MKNKIVFVANKTELILNEVNKNTPLIIVKKFFNHITCKSMINFCIKNHSLADHRKNNINKNLKSFSMDVLPENVLTKRIFRRFVLNKKGKNKFSEIKELEFLHKKILKKESKKKILRKFAVIHYPKGGGFFDWHKHIRYPTNYAFIITLTKKGKNFKKGDIKFKVGKDVIDLENHNLSIGDLLLFRYDLPHAISPIDPNETMVFDNNGRWSFIMFLD